MSIKVVRSKDYNYFFNSDTGFFARWGITKEDDPSMSPYGPEIADIEISTICNGLGKPCPWCYKSNTRCGKNMNFETFGQLFYKLVNAQVKLTMPDKTISIVSPNQYGNSVIAKDIKVEKIANKCLTQIAFGIGDINGNPDLWNIMNYCRKNEYNPVVPNITTNGMGVDEDIAQKLANVCGAVSVSRYHIEDICYDAIDKLVKAAKNPGATLKQVNIHQLLASETYDSCFKLLDDIKTDSRLAGLNAVVFLKLKPKGERNKFNSIESQEKFAALIKAAQDKGISIGMDSCTAPLMLKYCEQNNQDKIIASIEPCESTLFSIYINVDSQVFPCSFAEGTAGWEKGMDIREHENFLKDIWLSERLSGWRNGLLKSSSKCVNCKVSKHCRSCPIYDITICKEK